MSGIGLSKQPCQVLDSVNSQVRYSSICIFNTKVSIVCNFKKNVKTFYLMKKYLSIETGAVPFYWNRGRPFQLNQEQSLSIETRAVPFNWNRSSPFLLKQKQSLSIETGAVSSFWKIWINPWKKRVEREIQN